MQEEAARQHAPHAGYGKVTPPVASKPPNMPPPQMLRNMGPMGPGPGGLQHNPLPSIEQWPQRCV